jgi:hypothetical protein
MNSILWIHYKYKNRLQDGYTKRILAKPDIRSIREATLQHLGQR